MTPKISVIVPVYNVEKYLPRCIDSILSQSFTDFELILVDDGSPDNSGKICDEYAQKDNRVRVFHKSNGGVSSARNLGLDNARGEWVTFIDSDDHVDVDYLQELISFVNHGSIDWVVTLNTIKKHTPHKSVSLKYDDYNQLFSLYDLDKNGYVIGKLYKRDIVNRVNLRFNEKIHLGEDSMFGLLYLLETKNIVLIHSEKYFYENQRPGSLTKIFNSYESEHAGKKEFDRIVGLLIERLRLDSEAIMKLEISQKNYAARTLCSIIRISSCRGRVKKLEEIDLTQYYKHKEHASWRESLLLFLLRNKCFYLYDILIHLKR